MLYEDHHRPAPRWHYHWQGLPLLLPLLCCLFSSWHCFRNRSPCDGDGMDHDVASFGFWRYRWWALDPRHYWVLRFYKTLTNQHTEFQIYQHTTKTIPRMGPNNYKNDDAHVLSRIYSSYGIMTRTIKNERNDALRTRTHTRESHGCSRTFTNGK